MTAVVMARTYEDARHAANLLGLGNSWVYPHDVKLLRGLRIERVVYVSGWYSGENPGIPTDAVHYLQARLVLYPDAAVDAVDLDRPGGVPEVEVYASAPLEQSKVQADLIDRARSRPAWWPVLLVAAAAALCVVGVWLGW